MTFGASSSCVRAGFLLAEAAEGGGGALFGALGVGASMTLSTYGILWQTRGLRDGHSMVVCTAAAAATIVAATIIGLTALGESLPATRGHQALRLLGCAAILAGTTILGQGGLGELGDSLGHRGCPGVVPELSRLRRELSWACPEVVRYIMHEKNRRAARGKDVKLM